MPPNLTERHIMLLASLILAIGLLLTGCKPSSGATYAQRRVEGSVFAFPTSKNDTPDLLLTNYSYEEGGMLASYITQGEQGQREVLWEQKIYTRSTWVGEYLLPVLDEAKLYIPIADRIVALQRSDGAKMWERQVSKDFSHSCRQCLVRAGNHLVALSGDDVMQILNTADGTSLWQTTLYDSRVTHEGFWHMDNTVLWVDHISAEAYDATLYVLDIASTDIQHMQPPCPDARDIPDFDTENVFMVESDGSPHAIILYNCTYSDPRDYAASWDIDKGRLKWQVPLPFYANHSISAYLISKQHVYITAYDLAYFIDISNGDIHTLDIQNPDYDLTVLAAWDESIIFGAKRTRGTTQYELWTFDHGGQRLWQYSLEDNVRRLTGTAQHEWGVHLTPYGLAVVQLRQDDERILVNILNPQTGQELNRFTTRVESISEGTLTRGDDHVYLNVDNQVYDIDVQAGKIHWAWPLSAPPKELRDALAKEDKDAPPASPKQSDRRASGTILALPAVQDAQHSDLIVTTDYPGDNEWFMLNYVSPEDKDWQMQWEKRQRHEGWNWRAAHASFDETAIYYQVKNRLVALNRRDGEVLWATNLSDDIAASCPHCLQQIEEYIGVITADYVLQVLDTASGDILWSTRLNDTTLSRQGFWAANGRIALGDYISSERTIYALRLFNPANGNTSDIIPGCASENAFHFDNEQLWINENRALLFYECWSTDERYFAELWDLSQNEAIWRVPIPQDSTSSIQATLWGRHNFHIYTYYGIFTLDPTAGSIQQLQNQIPDSCDLTPLLEQGDIIVSRARCSGDGTSYALWGIGPEGQRIWAYALEADTLIDSDPGIADWAYHVVADQLLIIQMLDGDPDYVRTEKLNIQTGEVLLTTDHALDRSLSFDGITWGQQYGYLILYGDVYSVNLDTGAIEPVWP